MRIRRIAILIDGGFFIKRLTRLVEPRFCDTPDNIAGSARWLCKRHVQKLTGEPFNTDPSRWLDHVYRIFYYDAHPFGDLAHHPISNLQIQYSKTPEALFRLDLFNAIRRSRKFALRLGKVVREDGWHIKNSAVTKKLLRTRAWVHLLEALVENARTGAAIPALPATDIPQLEAVASSWRELQPTDLRLGLRQKGVDMRMGLDISTLTLKKQVDTIILVTGDSDFVPAAKLARREGVEFLLDPLWQSVNHDLHEHVDGVVSGFRRPGSDPADETPAEFPQL